jgi:(2Fe-2S) ferredoxin
LYRALGADAVIRDLKSVCQVTVATSRRGYWSYTQITAEDATRILDCVLRKAPTYTDGRVLIDALHGVDPEDRFGIPEALPSGTTVAVKNGWTAHSATGLWDLNCVASWDHYTLAVLTRYPIARGQDYGAGVCKDVTSTILGAQAG